MAGYLTLILTTLLLTGLFGILIASADIEEIKANWPKRRCEVPVVIASGLFKPSTDPRTTTEFAKENFQFCIRNLADEVLKIAFAPLYAVAGQQVNAQSTMTGPMNSIRAMIAQGMKTFSSIFEKQYRQYKAILIEVSKTWHYIRFAMGRIGGIVTSLVYLGLTASALVQNTMKLILNVILIFIGIMAAMILLIFFGILPFIGIIITMIVLLAQADAQTGGWVSGGNTSAGPFCVDPAAEVKMSDGSFKPLSEIRCGDQLDGEKENRVVGVLTVDSSKETIVVIDGVRMSDSHRVLYNSNWILAKNHPEAKPSDLMTTLICLNTTTHSVAVKSTSGLLYVGDWEETDSILIQRQWIQWVHKKLNRTVLNTIRYPTSLPIVSPDVKVCTPQGWVSLHTITIGQHILSEKGYTKVVGLYNGHMNVKENPKTPDWISDGIWIKSHSCWLTRGLGVHSTTEDDSKILDGMNLVVEDDCFYIQGFNGVFLIRDFTEVGASSMNECYSWLDEAINKKV